MNSKYKYIRGTLISVLLTLLAYASSGVALGLFLVKAHRENYFQFLWADNYYTGILLGILAVIILECMFYWIPRNGITKQVFSLKHATCYLPLLILSGIFLVDCLPMELEYHKAFFDYFYVTFLFEIIVSMVVFLKILTTNIFPSYQQSSSASEGKTIAHSAYSFEKGIWIFITIATIYFFCLLLKTNITLTDDSFYYYNMIWNLSRFSFTYSGSDLDIPTHIFGTHLNLILIPVAIVFRIWPHINFLILFQSLVISSAIIPLFFIGKRKSGSQLFGIAVSISFFFHPSIQLGHNWGIIVDLWGVSALIWAFYFLENKRPLLFLVFCLLTMSCKEVFAILIVGLSLWIWINHNDRRLAAYTFFLGLFWFIASVSIKNHLNMGVDVHGVFKEQLFHLIRNPQELVLYYADPKRMFTIIQFMVPLGFICVMSPLPMIAVIPFIALLFLDQRMYLIKNYYFAPVLPFFLISVIYGAGKLKKNYLYSRKGMISLSCFLIMNSIFSFIFFNPFNYSSLYEPTAHADTPHKKMVRSKLSNIPKDQVVSITPELRSLVSNRNFLYIFPRGLVMGDYLKAFNIEPFENPIIRDADYVVVDLQQTSHSEYPPEGAQIQDLLHNPNYGLDYFHDGLVIFKKGKNREDGLKTIFINQENISRKTIMNNYGEGLNLMSMKLSTERGLRRNDGLKVVLFWKVVSMQKEKFKVLISFSRIGSKKVTWLHTPLFGLIEPEKWQVGEIVKDSFIIPIGEEFVIHRDPYKIRIDVLRNAESINTENADKFVDDILILPSF